MKPTTTLEKQIHHRLDILENEISALKAAVFHLEQQAKTIEIQFENLRNSSLTAAEHFPMHIREAVTERLTPLLTAVEELRDSQRDLATAMQEFIMAEMQNRAEAIAEKNNPPD